MPKFEFGQEDWSGAPTTSGSGSGDGGTLFLRLEEGQNLVRVVSSPWKYWIHWANDALGKRKKIKCSLEGCPVCEKVEREMPEIIASGKKLHKEGRKPRWIFAAIDRSQDSDNIKLLDVGPQIVRGIRSLADKPQLGDPSTYDLDVTVNPNSMSEYYTVSAIPNGPDSRMKYDLTDKEKSGVEEFIKRIDIEKLITPDTPENIRKLLGMSEVAEPVKSEDPEGDEVDNDFSSDDGAEKKKKILNFG